MVNHGHDAIFNGLFEGIRHTSGRISFEVMNYRLFTLIFTFRSSKCIGAVGLSCLKWHRAQSMPPIDVPLFRPRIVNSRGLLESPLTLPLAKVVGRLFAGILGLQDVIQIVASFRGLDIALGTLAQLKGSDLFGLAWRGSEVGSTPHPQYLI